MVGRQIFLWHIRRRIILQVAVLANQLAQQVHVSRPIKGELGHPGGGRSGAASGEQKRVQAATAANEVI